MTRTDPEKRRPDDLLACTLCLSLTWTLAVAAPSLVDVGPSGLRRVIGYLLATAAVIWLIPRRTIGELHRASSPSFVIGLAAGAASYPIWVVGVASLGTVLALPAPAFLPGDGSDPTLLLAIGLVGPLFEELLYRGWLLGSLVPWLGGPSAVLASSVTFALPHGEPWSVLTAFLLGVVLALSRRLGAGLGACIGAHAGLNLAFLLRDPIALLEPPVWLGALGLLLWALVIALDRRLPARRTRQSRNARASRRLRGSSVSGSRSR